jgi:hypothetical protein
MSAQDRAARVAAQIQDQQAMKKMTSWAGTRFPSLRVTVKNGEIRYGLGKRQPLKGACAGARNVHPATGGQVLFSVLAGPAPKVGTLFVAFADGTRFESPLLQGSRAQMRKVDEEIALFNRLADLAEQK